MLCEVLKVMHIFHWLFEYLTDSYPIFNGFRISYPLIYHQLTSQILEQNIKNAPNFKSMPLKRANPICQLSQHMDQDIKNIIAVDNPFNLRHILTYLKYFLNTHSRFPFYISPDSPNCSIQNLFLQKNIAFNQSKTHFLIKSF